MRKLMFLALGAIVGLSFTACGNKQAQTGVYSDSTQGCCGVWTLWR